MGRLGWLGVVVGCGGGGDTDAGTQTETLPPVGGTDEPTECLDDQILTVDLGSGRDDAWAPFVDGGPLELVDGGVAGAIVTFSPRFANAHPLVQVTATLFHGADVIAGLGDDNGVWRVPAVELGPCDAALWDLNLLVDDGSVGSLADACALVGETVTLSVDVLDTVDFSANVAAVDLVLTSSDIDVDADGTASLCDNCPNDPNADQLDGDGDTVGDACDVCPDRDDRIDIDGNGTPDCLQ